MEENKMSISKILFNLFGEIEPYGDTNIDEERFKNIEKYYEALSFIISKLHHSAELKDRQEYSIQKIGQECYLILKEYGINIEEE